LSIEVRSNFESFVYYKSQIISAIKLAQVQILIKIKFWDFAKFAIENATRKFSQRILALEHEHGCSISTSFSIFHALEEKLS
jgi:hypothetical protein